MVKRCQLWEPQSVRIATSKHHFLSFVLRIANLKESVVRLCTLQLRPVLIYYSKIRITSHKSRKEAVEARASTILNHTVSVDHATWCSLVNFNGPREARKSLDDLTHQLFFEMIIDLLVLEFCFVDIYNLR